jgi:hypothetical protein
MVESESMETDGSQQSKILDYITHSQLPFTRRGNGTDLYGMQIENRLLESWSSVDARLLRAIRNRCGGVAKSKRANLSEMSTRDRQEETHSVRTFSFLSEF